MARRQTPVEACKPQGDKSGASSSALVRVLPAIHPLSSVARSRSWTPCPVDSSLSLPPSPPLPLLPSLLPGCYPSDQSSDHAGPLPSSASSRAGRRHTGPRPTPPAHPLSPAAAPAPPPPTLHRQLRPLRPRSHLLLDQTCLMLQPSPPRPTSLLSRPKKLATRPLLPPEHPTLSSDLSSPTRLGPETNPSNRLSCAC